MSPRPLPWAFAALLAAGLFSGCSESTLPVPVVYHPTLVEVSPDEFLAGVPCADAAGALRTYVATVFDVEYEANGEPTPVPEEGAGGETGAAPESEGDSETCPVDTTTFPRAYPGFALPSSGPISCIQPVAFSRVVPSHRYRAEINGYARADLHPLSPGAPIMVADDTGARVEPTWVWSCGDQCAELARIYTTRVLEDCKLIKGADAIPSGPASVALTLGSAQGAPACGVGAGMVDHFEVTLGDSTLSAACGETVTLSNLTAPGALTLPVLAYERDNPKPRWGATCTASPIAGLTVNARCPALSEEGTLAVDPATALAALNVDCATLDSLPGELELELLDAQGYPVGVPHFVDAKGCAASVRFTGIASGTASARATLRSGANELGQALCQGSIVPAQSVSASCSPEP